MKQGRCKEHSKVARLISLFVHVSEVRDMFWWACAVSEIHSKPCAICVHCRKCVEWIGEKGILLRRCLESHTECLVIGAEEEES